MFWVAYLVCKLGAKQNTWVSLVVAIATATVITFLAYSIREYMRFHRREVEREEVLERARERLRQEEERRQFPWRQPVPPETRSHERVPEVEKPPEPKPPQNPVFLERLELVIEQADNKHARRIGRKVNREEDRSIRPVAIVYVNKPEYAGRKFVFLFNLVGPREGLHYEQEVEQVLEMGRNLVFQPIRAKRITPKTPSGVWQIRLWLYGREWGQQDFVVTDRTEENTAAINTPDMEATPESQELAEMVAATTSIDELLED